MNSSSPMSPATASAPRLQLVGITKRYPAVVANDAVSLSVQPGQAHAILGENGAGKSTLMKIIYGSTQPDAGQVLFDGQPVQIRNPQQARQLGIAMVFQHFSLFDTLTVAQNVWLGLDKSLSLAEVTQRMIDKGRQYGLELDPQRPVHTLSVGEMQRVEIVRALLANPRLLILDEPTSVLTPQAVRRLFGTLRQLAAEGCSIVYISHKLDEIRELCNACTVMRMGKVTGYCDPRQETTASLSRLMIGAEPQSLGERRARQGGTLLQVRHLQLSKSHPFACELQDVSFDLHQGEILGVAGISGNGQQELLAALSGEDTRAQADMILLDGQPIAQRDAAWRRDQGMGFVPEERLGRGAVPELSLAQNLLLSHQNQETVKRGFLRFSSIRRLAGGIIKRFRVKTSNEQAAANSLSGGNLQKYIIGREVTRQPRILVIAQPTWGVDVGAAAQIHAELLALRDAGCALLVISEELDELFAIADRLIVISKGRMSPSIPVAQASVDQIGQWMSGLWTEDKHVQA